MTGAAGAPGYRLIDGDRLRATLFAEGGETGLYLTFRHRLNAAGTFSAARPAERARRSSEFCRARFAQALAARAARRGGAGSGRGRG